jgi:hypothetical protein
VNRMRWRVALLALPLALGACAHPALQTAAARSGPPPPSSPTPSTTPSTTPSGTAPPIRPGPAATAIDQTYRAAARAETVRLLNAFDPPPGAHRLIGPPPGVTFDRGLTPGSDARVTDVRWFSVPGSPAGIGATAPAGSAESVRLGPGSDGITGTGFDWPPTSMFRERELLIETMRVGADTIIRVDSLVLYLPARPAGAMIPVDRATALTVTMSPRSPSLDVTEPTLGPVTTTDPVAIARIATLFNTATMAPQGETIMCPMMTRGQMALVFRTGVGGPTVATVTISLTGCTSADLTVGSVEARLDGGSDQADAVISALNLTWPRP